MILGILWFCLIRNAGDITLYLSCQYNKTITLNLSCQNNKTGGQVLESGFGIRFWGRVILGFRLILGFTVIKGQVLGLKLKGN